MPDFGKKDPRTLTYDDYASDYSDAEKVLLAASQLLIGHRHYSAKQPDDNAVVLVELVFEGARRIVLAEGNAHGIAADHPDPRSSVASTAFHRKERS
jgi:hypothetical protein